MNGDIEALLRSGLAEQAERAPATVDDPALADLAIAGAHRIRRRRRVAAAASGAGLLVLGAGAFVLHPLLKGDDQAPSAADTTTAEVRNELGMEFVVQDGDGAYQVINEDGDRVDLMTQQAADSAQVLPLEDASQEVWRLEEGYLVVSHAAQTTELMTLDGTESIAMAWPSDSTYNVVNGAATEFAMVTPNAEVTEEDYEITSALISGEATTTQFTTSFELTLNDWSDSTTVFTADLWSTTAGESKTWHFDEQYDWNLASVGQAGYESAVIVDHSNPTFVCVADLEPGGGLAQVGEDCGESGSEFVQTSLLEASGDEEAVGLVDAAVAKLSGTTDSMFTTPEAADLGEYEDRFYQADYIQYDPSGRWELSYSRGDATWILVDYTGSEPAVSMLTPPAGAVGPVLDFRPPE
ncbi:hypothetical protein [Glycomyces terrestris]|uniref:Uncharacterized protein n=1 Tax=Glycomyces terrestris TaxID=2493553 RepID=A0A426UUJ6_9ACTN|nr:hypothetical protein [Glycomyces terrestris]RRR97655.1 hypothetical protein EIW28_19925 [Glycomyces terrestris]